MSNLRNRILEIVNDTPMTAQQILVQLGSETNGKQFQGELKALTYQGDIQRTQLSNNVLPTFTRGIDLPLEIPEFLKRASDMTGEIELIESTDDSAPLLRPESDSTDLLERLDAAFLELGKPKYVVELPDVKTDVLDRLADHHDSSIAEILMSIRADLVAFAE